MGGALSGAQDSKKGMECPGERVAVPPQILGVLEIGHWSNKTSVVFDGLRESKGP